MSFPRYPAYKPSGVEWLGEVPEHWDVKRVRRIFEIKKRIAGELGFDILSITQQGIKVRDPESNDGQVSMDYSKYQVVEPGDFAMNHMDLLTGYVDISRRLGVTSPDYRVFSIAEPSRSDPGYLLYIFQMGYRQKILYAYGQGSSQLGRWRLPTEEFQDWTIPFPSLEEQASIATFLDHETAKIDALIAEQKRLIELLQEKRQAVISHAVTKGLNPNAPMKDSGVEWLGEVPEHWNIRPLKSEIFFQEGPGIMAVDFKDEGIPLLRVSCVQGEQVSLNGCNYLDPEKVAQKWSHFMVAEGDLLLSGSASLGGVSEVGEEASGSIPYTGLIRVRPSSRRISRDFIKLLIESSVFSIQIDRLKAGATIQHFGPTHLRQMKITVPPADEQDLITKELYRAKTAFNGLIEKVEQAVALLQERRSGLISAAVTGQIDVRGLVEAEAGKQ